MISGKYFIIDVAKVIEYEASYAHYIFNIIICFPYSNINQGQQ